MTIRDHAIEDSTGRVSATPSMQGLIHTLRRFWRWSSPVCGQKGLRRLRARVSFVLKAWSAQDLLRPFVAPPSGGSLQRAFQQRPEIVGAIVWPYMCSTWSSKERIQRIDEHFRLIDSMGGALDFPIDQSFELIDLGDVQESLRVVLDRPQWFMREGQLVLNLFMADVRIYSIAFSFAFEGERTVAFVGAIQGGNADGAMADYKDLTKTLHGMRPRDFLVELLRSFCRTLGVWRIYAVADASRQHRSSYFGKAKSDTLSLNYDEIWSERGGIRHDADFFMLGPEAPLKSLEEIPSKKRSMYRKRYELLDSLHARIATACAGIRPLVHGQPAEHER
jgi:uncharacterized protein VirK/YbjX